MKDICRKFHRILLVELDDLKEDLDLFVSVMETRHACGEITDYVFNENLAVVRNEVLGIRDCVRGCEEIESTGIGTVDEIATQFKLRLRERLTEHGYVPALHALIDRRVDKIAAYLKREITEENGVRTGGEASELFGHGSETLTSIP